MRIEIFLAVAGLLMLLCVFANKVSDRFGIPSLLLFLAMGMLAGSDGIGGIRFQDARLTNYIGTVALSFILFSGGLDTKWSNVKPVIYPGCILSTLGVLLTALFLYLFTHYILMLPYDMALLLSVIVSSTDAPAVFAILRLQKIKIKDSLKSTLEFESGSNDPMAVFLSMAAIGVLAAGETHWGDLIRLFFLQMSLGTLLGLLAGKAAATFLRRWNLSYKGLYPVFGISVVFLSFSITQLLNGNGFLAVYLCGIVMGNTPFIARRQTIRFNDALAWIMQISMFLILGLLVNPHELKSVAVISFACTLLLMFVARPLAVFICLIGSRFNFKEKLLISWAGLKGAVPIILATYPLMQGFPNSQFLFNLIFFLVIISVLLQGKSLPWLARRLKLEKKDDASPEKDGKPISSIKKRFKRSKALKAQS